MPEYRITRVELGGLDVSVTGEAIVEAESAQEAAAAMNQLDALKPFYVEGALITVRPSAGSPYWRAFRLERPPTRLVAVPA